MNKLSTTLLSTTISILLLTISSPSAWATQSHNYIKTASGAGCKIQLIANVGDRYASGSKSGIRSQLIATCATAKPILAQVSIIKKLSNQKNSPTIAQKVANSTTSVFKSPVVQAACVNGDRYYVAGMVSIAGTPLQLSSDYFTCRK